MRVEASRSLRDQGGALGLRQLAGLRLDFLQAGHGREASEGGEATADSGELVKRAHSASLRAA